MRPTFLLLGLCALAAVANGMAFCILCTFFVRLFVSFVTILRWKNVLMMYRGCLLERGLSNCWNSATPNRTIVCGDLVMGSGMQMPVCP